MTMQNGGRAMTNTYWNSSGTYQAVADALQALIPEEGEVLNPRANPELEKFRKAVNCYYDLYNNGLCNRKQEFRSMFKVGIAQDDKGYYDVRNVAQLESEMDEYIRKAAAEQDIRLDLATEDELEQARR
jgi:hypothetical protein